MWWSTNHQLIPISVVTFNFSNLIVALTITNAMSNKSRLGKKVSNFYRELKAFLFFQQYEWGNTSGIVFISFDYLCRTIRYAGTYDVRQRVSSIVNIYKKFNRIRIVVEARETIFCISVKYDTWWSIIIKMLVVSVTTMCHDYSLTLHCIKFLALTDVMSYPTYEKYKGRHRCQIPDVYERYGVRQMTVACTDEEQPRGCEYRTVESTESRTRHEKWHYPWHYS